MLARICPPNAANCHQTISSNLLQLYLAHPVRHAVLVNELVKGEACLDVLIAGLAAEITRYLDGPVVRIQKTRLIARPP